MWGSPDPINNFILIADWKSAKHKDILFLGRLGSLPSGNWKSAEHKDMPQAVAAVDLLSI